MSESPTPVADEVRPAEGTTSNVDLGHEPLTVNVRALGISLVGLTVIIIAALALMWALFAAFDRFAIEQNPDVPELRQFSETAPEPRLNPDQPALRREVQQAERAWMKGKSDNRISIDDARAAVLKFDLNTMRFKPATPVAEETESGEEEASGEENNSATEEST